MLLHELLYNCFRLIDQLALVPAAVVWSLWLLRGDQDRKSNTQGLIFAEISLEPLYLAVLLSPLLMAADFCGFLPPTEIGIHGQGCHNLY